MSDAALHPGPAGDLAARFDRHLEADAHGGAFSRASLAELDRMEEFPAAACRRLDELGLPSYYVPAGHGGSLRSHEELLLLWRAVARRDLTVAVAHAKTYLGAVCVWLAGRPDQVARLATQIADGDRVSWGLTERAHGSDLLAGEVSARPCGTGWRLTGEKFLINNATRGQLICVLARTAPNGGARGFSLFLVDKRELPAKAFHCLAKVPTHGIRGADISGISFHDAEVASDALVGAVGQGAEVVLKALQLTRTVSVGLSLGAVDHAVRLSHDFARDRSLYGRRLLQLPRVRRLLGSAYVGVFLAEAVSVVAARSAHALTAEMSVISAVTKSFVPTLVDHLIADLGELLGARAFLTDVYADGAFQKLERDHRIVGIFDGSTVVNLNAVINHFPRLAKGYADARGDAAGLDAAGSGAAGLDTVGLHSATSLLSPLSEVDPGRLGLVSTNGCSVVQSLPDAVRSLHAQCDRAQLPTRLVGIAQRILAAVDEVHREMAEHRPSARNVPRTAFDVARRYELCFAAAACLRLWLHNWQWVHESGTPPLWRDGLWLEACLVDILARLTGRCDKTSHDRLFDELQTRTSADPAVSLLPTREGEPRT